MTNSNRLYRSNTDKVIGGVAGGLGDYLNIDPVIVRVLFVLLAIFGGSGVLVYIILWIAIPAEIHEYKTYADNQDEKKMTGVNDNPEDLSRRKNTSLIVGIIMIVMGLIFLIDHIVPIYSIKNLWPLLLVIAGVLLISPELFKSSKNIKS
jgi:phage shock protein C